VSRTILRGFFIFAALVVALGAAAFGYRAWRQYENAIAFAIRTPNGIDEAAFVKIGGIEQWVQIRGDDRNNPVILIVHGGPGISMIPMTAIFRPWEKYFTVVQWDQRGSGKTYGYGGKAGQGVMTIARMTQDGIELAQYLRAHLRKKRIVVLGHSWGTVLATLMVKQQPDLFSAYVGTGELVDKQANEMAVYAGLMNKLQAAHDESGLAALRKVGPPPYDDIDRLYAQRKLLAAHDTAAEQGLQSKMTPIVLFAPNYSLTDIYDFLTAPPFAQRMTYAEENAYDARKLGTRFDVPVFIFEGDEDAMTPVSLSAQYFATVRAPKKAFVLLKGGGHTAILTMSDAFLKELVARVRPAAIQNETGASHG
jgi:pimeloyl-ACP methyl ester carboxylesterase